MRSSLLVGLSLLVLVVAPGVAAAGPAGSSAPGPGESTAALADQSSTAAQQAGDACEAVAGGSQRPNPAQDRLGWENGCWHDDPIAVTVDDGLNQTELDAVVARTMARVEAVRDLEFEKTVPVEVISRETFKEENEGAFANVSEAANLHQDVKYEALFFVPEDEDALAQLEANRGGSVLGYYSPAQDRIVIISDSDGPLKVDGPTLAHELAHALQDQQFNLTRYERSTTEQDNAINGLVEGDPTYTEYLYNQRCDDGWACPSRDSSSGNRPGAEFDWGIYFMGYQPYSDGGSFVEQLKERGGWEAVNEAYDNPPASSEQVMYPEKYPGETPNNVTVVDRSDDEWRILDLEVGVDYAVYGEAGMASMFISPTYDDLNPRFISQDQLLTGGSLDSLNYNLAYTDGWDGDKLYPYVTNDSFETNETGYVWKTHWDSPADAREFEEGYVAMLEYRGASEVSSRVDTYRIPEEEPFGDAFYVNRTGTTVVVVNAPTVADLSGVRAGAAPEATPTPTDTPTQTATPSTGVDDDPTTTVGDDSPRPTEATSPGFGLVVAVLVALGSTLVIGRR